MTPVLLAILLQAAPTPAPACTATAAPPAGLEAWSTISAITKGPIAIGQGTGLQLQPIDKITLLPTPGKPPQPGSVGGVYQFNVAATGTYRVALSTAAWIEILRDGKSLESVAHTHGPACSGIRKIVDFTLAPGRYTLQLTNAKDATMRVLIAPK